MKDHHSENELALLNRLLEQLHQADYRVLGSIEINVHLQATPGPSPAPSPVREGSAKGMDGREGYREGYREDREGRNWGRDEGICQCIAQLMEERVGDGSLFNRQSHWQAVYRILVDKGYCRDSDFDGFDAFIHAVMPEKVNKPYRKDSVKIISQTDFNKPFDKWRYDSKTSGTRKPFERMCTVAGRFKELLEKQGL